MSRLKKHAKDSSRILLATDEDREGEAISWHLLEVLQPKVPVKRAVFHEITKSAIMEAFSNPREVDMNLVQSQETRRIVDRLTGFTLSPLLWRYIAPGLSAGRVQSCGLDMITARERARWAFKSSKYYSVDAWFAPANDPAAGDMPASLKLLHQHRANALKSRLMELKGQKVAGSGDFDGATGELKNSQGTKELPLVLDRPKTYFTLRWMSGADSSVLLDESLRKPMPRFVISDRKDRNFSRSAPVPFITSSLQQESSQALGYSPAHTMSIAQDLYEKGFITYMRTDSPLLSSVAREAAERHVEEMFGKDYLNSATGGSEGKKDAPKNAQEAHEAIRPAEVQGRFRAPFETQLDGAHLKLYSLIYRRTLASLMANSESLSTTYTIDVDDGAAVLRTSGTRVAFPGYLAALRMPVDKAYSPVPFEYKEGLPDLETGTELELLSPPVTDLKPEVPRDKGDEEQEKGKDDNEEDGTDSTASETEEGLSAREHLTRPPSRFTEASFVKELEAAGVGRPSTYAQILNILKSRGYMKVDRRTLVPTPRGMIVASLMKEHFLQIVDPHFTASMEAGLDEIASGAGDKNTFLSNFYLGDGVKEDGSSGLLPAVAEKMTPGAIDPKEARMLTMPALDGLGNIVVGRSGYYIEEVAPDGASAVEGKSRRWKLPEELQEDMRAITPEAVRELMKHAITTEGAALGRHPDTDQPVWLRSGRYGKYLQVGEDDRGAKNKSTYSVPDWLDATHSLEEVLQFTNLPRHLPNHPQLALPMLVDVHSKKLCVGVMGYPHRVALEDGVFPKNVMKAMAARLLNDTEKITTSKIVLGMWGNGTDAQEVVVQQGRWGPYVSAGDLLAGLRKISLTDVTLEMAIEILETRGKKRGSSKSKGKSKSTKASAKSTQKDKSPQTKRLTSWQMFCKEMRPMVSKKNPDMRMADVTKELSARWKSMDDEEKAVYRAKAQADADAAAEALARGKSEKQGPNAFAVFVSESSQTAEAGKHLVEAAGRWESLDDESKAMYETKAKALASERKIAKRKRNKGGTNAYIIFGSEMRPKIMEQNPGMDMVGVQKILAAQWNALDDEAKASYKSKAGALTPKVKKRAPTAYAIFTSEMRARVVEQHPDMKFTEIAKELGARWKALDDEAKDAYKAKAAAVARERNGEAAIPNESRKQVAR